MPYKLMSHQKKTVRYMLENPYCILGLEMGTGKSLCALDLWRRVGGHMLIVCPSYLVPNWKAEITKFLGTEVQVTAIRKGKDIYHLWDTDIALISYDLAQKAEEMFEWCTTLVCDEAHELKSMEAKKTEFIHRVVFENSVPRVYLMTGTPIKNRVQEFYSLIAICNYNPDLNGKSKFLSKYGDSITFADHFSHRHQYTIQIKGRYVTIVKWEGLKNLEELRSYLKGIYIRFRSSEVIDLPPLSYKDVLVSELPDKALEEEFTSFYEDKNNHSVDATAKALAALKTVPFTVQYVKSLLEQVDCAVVYTDHVQSCLALGQALGWPAITGAMPSEKRMGIAKDFQEGKIPGLVATIKSFSTGVNLIRAADIVQNDLSWIPGDQSQMEFRIQRIGQKRHCTIHRIFGSPQAAKIGKTLEDKMKTIAQTT